MPDSPDPRRPLTYRSASIRLDHLRERLAETNDPKRAIIALKIWAEHNTDTYAIEPQQDQVRNKGLPILGSPG